MNLDVEHIAKLARLGLAAGEKEKFAKDLGAILDFVDKLKEVDVEGVEPTAQVMGLASVVRVDDGIKRDAASRQRILDSAPDKKGSYIKVKEIFE